MRRLGRARLTRLLVRHSGGAWRDDKADQSLAAADDTLTLWADGGLDFAELAAGIASEVRTIQAITAELAATDARIAQLYQRAEPGGIFTSAPGLAVVSAAGILGRLGDPNRFANL